MLKTIAQLALVIVPLTALTTPLSAAMLAGIKSPDASVIHQAQKRGKRPPSSCASQMVMVTGKQRITEGQAKGSAEKAWQEKVRFTYGELYLDLKNAREATHRCTLTSPTLRLKRCEFSATPCRAPASI
jgi:hypothetical protein